MDLVLELQDRRSVTLNSFWIQFVIYNAAKRQSLFFSWVFSVLSQHAHLTQMATHKVTDQSSFKYICVCFLIMFRVFNQIPPLNVFICKNI